MKANALTITPLFLLVACSTAKPIDIDIDGGDDQRADASSITPTADAATNPDGAPVSADAAVPGCPSTPCDFIEQCGCAAGEACDLAAADPLSGNECRAVTSPGTETSTCTTPRDCAAGYTCLSDGAGAASCKAYCDPGAGNSGCDAPRGQCVIQLSSGGTDIAGAVMCSSNCDPTNVAAGGCPAQMGCFLYSVGTTSIVDCATAGAGIQDATCTNYEDCAPDHLCLDTGGASKQCLRICNNVNAACAAEAGKTCTGFTNAATIGGTEYGVCF